jgi:hypothetical protein
MGSSPGNGRRGVSAKRDVWSSGYWCVHPLLYALRSKVTLQGMELPHGRLKPSQTDKQLHVACSQPLLPPARCVTTLPSLHVPSTHSSISLRCHQSRISLSFPTSKRGRGANSSATNGIKQARTDTRPVLMSPALSHRPSTPALPPPNLPPSSPNGPCLTPIVELEYPAAGTRHLKRHAP